MINYRLGNGKVTEGERELPVANTGVVVAGGGVAGFAAALAAASSISVGRLKIIDGRVEITEAGKKPADYEKVTYRHTVVQRFA